MNLKSQPSNYFAFVLPFCLGINECDLFPGICPNATCVDRTILYECLCDQGFEYNEETMVCDGKFKISHSHRFLNLRPF